MARLADGDRTASREVFELVWPSLERFTRRVLGNGADAEDAAQLSLEKIFARASDYDDTRPALTWALAIAAWECKSFATRRRRSSSREGSHAVDALHATGPNPEEALLSERVLEAVREALASLDERDRATLEHAFLEDHDTPMDPKTRKRKERALDRLRTAMRKFYGR